MNENNYLKYKKKYFDLKHNLIDFFKKNNQIQNLLKGGEMNCLYDFNKMNKLLNESSNLESSNLESLQNENIYLNNVKKNLLKGGIIDKYDYEINILVEENNELRMTLNNLQKESYNHNLQLNEYNDNNINLNEENYRLKEELKKLKELKNISVINEKNNFKQFESNNLKVRI